MSHDLKSVDWNSTNRSKQNCLNICRTVCQFVMVIVTEIQCDFEIMKVGPTQALFSLIRLEYVMSL